MRISDWSSDVCSSDLRPDRRDPRRRHTDRSEGPRAGGEGNRRTSRSAGLKRPPLAAPPPIAHIPRHDQSPCAKRSEEHTSELQSLMRISYAVFCLKKKK